MVKHHQIAIDAAVHIFFFFFFFFPDHASPRQGPTNVREGRSQRRCAEVPEHSVLVRGAPPQHDEDDEQ